MTHQSLPDTQYFKIQYDDSPTIPGLSLATSLSKFCDSDFEYMRDQWFGQFPMFTTKITLYITIVNDSSAPPTCSLTQAGYNCWQGPSVWFAVDNSTSIDDIRYSFILEVSEMFMMFQGKGWFGAKFCNDPNKQNEGSTGEALSHFLAQQFEAIKNLNSSYTKSYPANKWMTSTTRQDWVTQFNPCDSTVEVEFGCGVVFLYYLKDQLGISIKDIIANGPNNSGILQEVYQNLTGETTFPDFWEMIQEHFPGTTPIPNTSYSPFPLPFPGWQKIGYSPWNVTMGKGLASSFIFAENRQTKDIWKWNGVPDPNDWTRIGGPGSMFAATSNDLFGLSRDGQGVYRYKGTPETPDDWEQIGGPAGAIFTDFNNLYAINPDTGDLWKWNGTPFNWGDKPIGGPGATWEGTSNDLFGLSRDGQGVYRYKGTPGDWEQIGGPAEDILTDFNNLYARNADTGDILKWNGTPDPNNWTRIGGRGSFACTNNKLFGLSPDGQGVYRWSGVANKWKKVGWAADGIFAGGKNICALSPNTHDIWWNPNLA